MQPFVSIAIPFYNHNHFIQQTLDSILQDTYANKEIIIINDGSPNPDDSNIISWIEMHSDAISVKYIKRENRGVTKTLNELITLAKGDYILFLASDDYLINNTIARRVEKLENNPQKLMLVSDAIVVDDDGKQLFESAMFEQRGAPKKNYFTDRGLKKEIIKRWSIVGPTGFISKKLFEIVGTYDESLMIEDWDFYLRVVAKDLLLFHDEKVAAYRWHANNISKDKKSEHKRNAELCQTMKQNIKHFSFPYNYTLKGRYKRCLKRLKR